MQPEEQETAEKTIMNLRPEYGLEGQHGGVALPVRVCHGRQEKLSAQTLGPALRTARQLRLGHQSGLLRRTRFRGNINLFARCRPVWL